jgi:exodeoxyribonuclease V gamma subunit
VRAADALLAGGEAPGSVDVRAFVGERAVMGTVPGLAGDLVRAVTFSRLAPRHRVAAWGRLLALSAARPERAFAAATIGRAAEGDGVEIARIGPLGADPAERRAVALEHLAILLDLHDRGMREPLPLYCKTSAAYARAAAAGGDAARAARGEWASAWSFDREDREPEHQLVLGGVRTFEQLLEEPPRPDEAGEGWAADETTRLGRLSRRLWDGMLPAETIERAA